MAEEDGSASAAAVNLTASLTLAASYHSPSNAAFTHVHKLSAPKSTSPADRVAYLGALRKATVELQERINSELTNRMEEDKLRTATDAAVATKSVVDESKEEENYGEEAIEEDN
jgi:hypothetical protein